MPVAHIDMAAVLAGRPQRVVAFDVFDTLVARTIAPEHVKRLSLDRLRRRLALEGVDGESLYALRFRIEATLCQAAADAQGELEFRFAEMGRQLHADLLARGVDLHGLDAGSFAALLLDCELAVEREVLEPIPGALAAVQAVLAAGRTVVLVSDFYLPATALTELLTGCGFGAVTGRFYVSSDHLASKRSGRLYARLLADLAADLGVTAADILMVGDNPHADVAMAGRHGIASLYVDDAARKAFYKSPEAEATNLAAARQLFDRLLEQAPPRNARPVAPALLLFIERVYGEARRRGWRHLFFLAREGQPLLAMFESYQDSLGLTGAQRITGHYLMVSRRATFVAALGPLDEESFDGLFVMYRRISLRDFLRSLRFDAATSESLARDLAVDADQVQEDFPSSALFRRLRDLPRFRQLYEAIRQSQRDLLSRYVASFGVPLDRHPLVLVDVGWKGTIQDFLTRALPEADIHGWYLGLLSIGQSLHRKSGLLFSIVGGLWRGHLVYTENRSLFEIILCADHGSALNYVDDPVNDGVRVELDDDADELAFIHRTVIPLRNDLLEAFGALCRLRNRFVLDDGRWARFAIDCHADFVFRPWLPAARWLAEAQHRENFGVFGNSKFTSDQGISWAGRLHFFYRLLRYRRNFLFASFWPAYNLYSHLGRGPAWLYGRYRQLRDRGLLAGPPPIFPAGDGR